jgi:hypothetical protein
MATQKGMGLDQREVRQTMDLWKWYRSFPKLGDIVQIGFFDSDRCRANFR